MTNQRTHNSARRNALLVILLLILALVFRIAFIVRLDLPQPVRVDAQDYFMYAYNLVHSGVYSKTFPAEDPQPDAWRSPGYPLLVALVMLIGGEKHFYTITIYVQVILSTLIVLATYFLGRRLMPIWAALTAAGLVALSPHLISTSSLLLSETFFGLMLLVAIQAYYWALQNKTVGAFVLSALSFGVAYLINETALLIPGILAFSIFCLSKVRGAPATFKKTMWLTVGMLFIFCLFPAVWMMRNAQLPPEAPRGSDRAVATMSHGAYPGFIYKDPKHKYHPYRDDPQQPAFSESFYNFGVILWQRFKQRPLRYMCWYLLEKPYYMWSWDNLQSKTTSSQHPGRGDVYIYPVRSSLYLESTPANLTRQLMKALHPILLCMALFGMVIVGFEAFWDRKIMELDRTPIILFIILLYYTFLYTVFAPWPRYSVPLRPELYLCAMWTVSKIRDKFMVRSTTKTAFTEQ